MTTNNCMKEIHIITPVKDSIDLALETIRSVLTSRWRIPVTYTVYNDFSSYENTRRLENASRELGFELINLRDITMHPSPNYLLVLQMAQKRAIESWAGLLIVESDVIVQEDTLQGLFDGATARPDCGIAAAVTVDENGAVNYPYLYASSFPKEICEVKRHCSFCCSLLTLRLLESVDFRMLNPDKNWFDVAISHESIHRNCRNYLFMNLPVWHRPHGSRSWKNLKYSNPLKYYWLKFTRGLDKI